MSQYIINDTSYSEISCGKCGITFLVPTTWRDERSNDKETFYCPNGHGRAYKGPATAETLRKQVEAKELALQTARKLMNDSDERAAKAEKKAKRLAMKLKRIGMIGGQ